MLHGRTIRPTVLADLIDTLPPDAALWRSIDPDAIWGLTEHLLAFAIDLLAAANWQRSGDKNAPRPKQIPRPGVEPEGQAIEGDLMTIEEAAEWLGWG